MVPTLQLSAVMGHTGRKWPEESEDRVWQTGARGKQPPIWTPEVGMRGESLLECLSAPSRLLPRETLLSQNRGVNIQAAITF